MSQNILDKNPLIYSCIPRITAMCGDVMFLPNDSDTIVMNGRKFADEYAERVLKPRCIGFKGKYGRLPKLVTILVGENPASESYLRIKSRFFSTLCLDSEVLRLSKDINERDLLNTINSLNNNSNVDGILVQLPLPRHIDADKVIESISIERDVEGLSPGNVHAWAKAIPNLVPATALGVLALLKYYEISLEGKHTVIVGRSMIVGKPVLHLLLKENCTVTICHSRTKQLGRHTRQADILIAAVGKAHLITADMVKKGAVVVDVGVNFLDGKLVGDVDFKTVKSKTSYISPVPGGSGPATVSMLAGNLLLAAELQKTGDNKEQKECLRDYYKNYTIVTDTNYC